MKFSGRCGVTLKSNMGDDLLVVNSARVSFAKENLGDIDNSDIKLIKFLSKNNHWTPFGHPSITLVEKVPIFVARQRFKHMVGFCYNEVSRRYVTDEPEFFIPEKWRGQHENKKQGSNENVNIAFLNREEKTSTKVLSTTKACLDTYNILLDAGVCAEQARMVLPQNMFTEYYVTGSLAAWARAYNLRIEGTAQKEIRDLAKQWDQIISPLYPVSWKALTSQ